MNWTKKIEKSCYSSTGPGNKGILKLDVLAIGTKVFSSKSRAHSSQPHWMPVLMTGTSMATQNVAGGALLIHHYFLSGNWTDKVSLERPITRALLINSCRHPLNSKSPDITFVHGVVDLSKVLPVENDLGVQITNQQQQKKKPFVTQNGHVQTKLEVDTMLNMNSPIPITHDLDIIVISPT